ncbi:MAG: cupin domain-containing protein [Paracoccaceae bacterium]
MSFPGFIKAFPSLDVPFPDDVVQTHAIRSNKGLTVFFEFFKDFTLPPHSHKDQWGTVVAGTVALTIDGKTSIYKPGDSYFIPSGVVHGVSVTAGTKAIDVFEEPDRYGLRG